MLKHIRIQIDGNKSYLIYQRGLFHAIELIKPIENHSYYGNSTTGGLKGAFTYLKVEIGSQREALRNVDKLTSKGSESILKILNRKRERVWRECLNSKKPVTLHKHVGVEIEFVSESTREAIAKSLALAGLASFTELKSDGSVHGGSSGIDGDCDGSCRSECECYECGEYHYCDEETECTRQRRRIGTVSDGEWEYRDGCTECNETETIEDCECGGQNEQGENVCNGAHVVCSGHCPGHYCQGYDDHDNNNCECDHNDYCGGNDGNSGHELAIVAKSTQIASVISKACKVLADHKAEVNSTCGLHVHIDMRNRDEKQAFANLVKSQKLLYSMVPRSRYENTYCKPNDKGLKMDSYQGRYLGINPSSYGEHGTIEVRLHSGTVNAEKINNWIKLLQAIAYSKRVPKIVKLSDLVNNVKLPSTLIEYIEKRLATFANKHQSYSVENDLNIQIELPLAA